MDPVLHGILKKCLTKYLEGKEQTKYNVCGKTPDDY